MKIKVFLLLGFEQKLERFLPSAASVKKNPGPLFHSTHFYSLMTQKLGFFEFAHVVIGWYR